MSMPTRMADCVKQVMVALSFLLPLVSRKIDYKPTSRLFGRYKIGTIDLTINRLCIPGAD